MKKNGFTLIELIVVVLMLVVAFAVVSIGICGNQYYTRDGVLSEVQVQNPGAKKVHSSKRRIFSSSEILVENTDGSRTSYLLDSNLLFNYDLQQW